MSCKFKIWRQVWHKLCNSLLKKAVTRIMDVLRSVCVSKGKLEYATWGSRHSSSELLHKIGVGQAVWSCVGGAHCFGLLRILDGTVQQQADRLIGAVSHLASCASPARQSTRTLGDGKWNTSLQLFGTIFNRIPLVKTEKSFTPLESTCLCVCLRLKTEQHNDVDDDKKMEKNPASMGAT
eukprot:2414444-Amphidinium_carterae.1